MQNRKKIDFSFTLLSILSIYLGCVFSIFSQTKINNNWYFGNNAGITFNTVPPSALMNGALVSLEGCASISDDAGQLLFYSNGGDIWNANHQIMPNGNNLAGFHSASQGTVIVPKPGSKTNYYVFTTSAQELSSKFLHYTEVDMSLDGGLGDVIPSQKNIVLVDSTSERITSTIHGNGLFYWVVTNRLESNQYYSFLIDCNGVNPTPIISTPSTLPIGPVGEIIFSPDGNHYATNRSPSRQIEYGQFDNTTGILSNGQNFSLVLQSNPSSPVFPASLSFSSNNKFLYTTSPLYGEIFQFDVTAPVIVNSQILVGQNNGSVQFFGINNKLQLGPDNKIYISQLQSNFLGLIDDPNAAGTACNYVENAISLDTNTASVSLPQLVKKRQPLLDFTVSNPCLGTTTHFSFSSTTPFDSVRWDFGEPSAGNQNFSSSLSPSHHYSQPGTYEVQVVSYFYCVSDTVKKTITIGAFPALSYNIAPKCVGDSTTFTVLQNPNDTTTFTTDWTITKNGQQFAFSDSSFHYIFQDTGLYHVQLIVNANGCSDTSFVQFQIYAQPIVNILTTAPCATEAVLTAVVTLPENENYSLTWQIYNNLQLVGTFSDNPLFISENGLLQVNLIVTTAFDCSQKVQQELSLSQNDSDFAVPNVLKISSTGGNNRIDFNALFPAFNNCMDYVFSVYNRWGNLVYTYKNDKNNPDTNCTTCFKGMTLNGEKLSAGTYFYVLQGEDHFTRKGSIAIFD